MVRVFKLFMLHNLPQSWQLNIVERFQNVRLQVWSLSYARFSCARNNVILYLDGFSFKGKVLSFKTQVQACLTLNHE